jgi:hypothetical protein
VTTERTAVPRAGGERELLRAYLDFHRETLALKCAGLTDDELRRRTTPSSLSLLSLVRHMAEVERSWFRRVLALILTSKVLSPQYLVWLLPFLPVVAARSRFMLWFSVVGLALTLVIFPVAYGALIAQHPVAVLLLNARNLLLVALFTALLWKLARGEARSGFQASGVRGGFSAAPTQLSPKSTVGP